MKMSDAGLSETEKIVERKLSFKHIKNKVNTEPQDEQKLTEKKGYAPEFQPLDTKRIKK